MNEPERLIPPHGGYPPDKQERATKTVFLPRDGGVMFATGWRTRYNHRMPGINYTKPPGGGGGERKSALFLVWTGTDRHGRTWTGTDAEDKLTTSDE